MSNIKVELHEAKIEVNYDASIDFLHKDLELNYEIYINGLESNAIIRTQIDCFKYKDYLSDDAMLESIAKHGTNNKAHGIFKTTLSDTPDIRIFSFDCFDTQEDISDDELSSVYIELLKHYRINKNKIIIELLADNDKDILLTTLRNKNAE